MKSKTGPVLFLSIVFVVIFSLVLAGCGGKASPTTPLESETATPSNSQPAGQTAEEIVSEFLAATETITTLKFDMDFDMSLEITGGSQPGKLSLQQSGTSSIDAQSKKMTVSMDMAVDIPDQGNQMISAEVYGIDGWVYSKVGIPLIGDQWFKMKVSDEEWKKQSGLSDISEFLKSPITVEVLGSEVVKGVDCYVLQVTPDMAVLEEWVRGLAQEQQSGIDLSKVDLTKTFKNIQVKEWIGKDSKMLMQENVAIVAEISAADFGSAVTDFDKLTLDISGIITYYDYGQPVEIILPPEAANAQEIAPSNSGN